MPGHSLEAVQHPRVIELARSLKDRGLEWDEVQTGDWFYVSGAQHVVVRTEEKNGHFVLHSQTGDVFEIDQAVLLPHLTQCHEWLARKGYDLSIEDLPGNQVKATSHRRLTEFRIERIEPNEMAAVYAVMIEVLDLEHFGWG